MQHEDGADVVDETMLESVWQLLWIGQDKVCFASALFGVIDECPPLLLPVRLQCLRP